MLKENISFLRVETDRKTGKSEIEVGGPPPHLLFNLTVLISQVCDLLEISPEEYTIDLADAVKSYRTMIKERTAIGYNPFKRDVPNSGTGKEHQ